MSLLEIDGLSFSYENYTEKASENLFENLSFSVEENENVLIIGEPGTGKSTLSSLILSFYPKFITGKLSGNLMFLKEDLKKKESSDLTPFITLVPQNTQSYLITTTVEEEIVFPLESLGLEREEIKKRLDYSLSYWGLSSYREVGTSELSGGESRRLLLCINEAIDPKLSVYDEAFDELDIEYKKKLRDKIALRKNASLVFCSHYSNIFDKLFDKIYFLENKSLHRVEEDSIETEISKLVKPSFLKTETSSILTAENIKLDRKRSDGTVFKLSVPHFQLNSGEIVAISGLNGSGKSSFALLLQGIIEPDEGSVLLDDKKIEAKTRKRSIGYIFQNPDYQIFLPTVRDELLYGLSFLKLKNKEREELLEKTADLFSLDLSDNALLLSYGKRKVLQAAIYYLLDRKFYILDEIDSALSYKESAHLINTLSSNGAGLLLISHDEETRNHFANRTYHIENGVLG